MTRTGAKVRVAFQGEPGAFSEEAAVKLLGAQIETVPRPTFESMFAAIDDGAADFILAPVENSLAGSVYRCYDLLLESKLSIIAEVILPISHNLIGAPGATIEQVRFVQSHPVALAQCTRFFDDHPNITRVAAEDTGGSVREVVRLGNPQRAAIASRRAAEIYGGCILQTHLEDHRHNYTRFVLLSAQASMPLDANKISLVVFLLHQPGALHRALEPIAQEGINLVKIESRPIVGQPFEYCFYLDLIAPPEAPKTRAALEELRRRTREVRILGCYVAAPPPVPS
ncbi:MAG TPA: prephenate dehydratase domain-containing protein [Terriglobales bacterium]|nr:prephenate dehydratase domain-containing protein [Terriglobales bacterium]